MLHRVLTSHSLAFIKTITVRLFLADLTARSQEPEASHFLAGFLSLFSSVFAVSRPKCLPYECIPPSMSACITLGAFSPPLHGIFS